ncbi:MAG: hypothetical protein AAF847_13540 [Bacteroidota bacterium]
MDYYLHPQNAFQRIWQEYLAYDRLIVAYDFDNTVYDYHQNGWTFEATIALLRSLKAIGCYLIVFTAREEIAFVEQYCQQQQIPFDRINENAPFIRSKARKIYYNVLLDDRAGLKATYDLLQQLIQRIMLQQELQDLLLPILEERGKRYQKNKNIFARKAREGEAIATITKDGLETQNTAKANSYVIRNRTEAQEEYIIDAQKFEQKYDFLQSAKDGWSEYLSKGKIQAIELTDNLLATLQLDDPFYFIAAWGERMIARKGDFMACPQGGREIYRIARKEFFETYVLLK